LVLEEMPGDFFMGETFGGGKADYHRQRAGGLDGRHLLSSGRIAAFGL
jgi:hypothetical protein